jgi:hypothetical protein
MMSLIHVKEKMEWADRLSTADLLPAAYRRKPANVLVAIEYGDALGMPPIVAMNMIHVIEGKPTLSAQAIGGLVRRAGHKLRVRWDGNAMRATAEVVRADDPDFTFTATWDMDRARAAKLTGKGVWQQYPDAMLKARAITEVARDACPEALFGVAYTPEELGADDPETNGVETISAPPQESASVRFRQACADANLDADEIMATAGVTEINDTTLPQLRDAFKTAKEQATQPDLELEAVKDHRPEPEIVEAEIVEDTPPIPRTRPKKAAPKEEISNINAAQRGHLMALATRLEWNRDDRLSYANEIFGTNIESWNELTSEQGQELIARMGELADMVAP